MDGAMAKKKSSKKEAGSGGVPVYMYVMAGCAALNSTNIGFDLGVSGGVALDLQEDLNLTDAQIGLFLAMPGFVAAFGGLGSQFVTDMLGRRLTFTVGQIILILGLLACIFSSSFVMIMAGRVFIGLGVGIAFAIDYLYIAELAPSAHRGSLVSWAEVAINVGLLIGACANRAFANAPVSSWRTMVGIGLILPIVLTVLSLFVMPETPRFLLARGKKEEAAKILKRTHPKGADIDSVVEGIEKERKQDEENDKGGWSSVLCPDRSVRRALIVGIGVAFAQQINASESVVMYSATIFKRAHVATTKAALFNCTVLTFFMKMFFVILAGCMVDSAGRRPLLISSVTVTALCLFGLAIGTAMDLGWLAVVSVCVFMAAFSMGIGPVVWLLCAEMFPSSVRAKGMSLGAFVNRLTSALIAFSYLPMAKAVGGQANYFAIFGFVTTLSAVYIWALVPETKGLSLEESSHAPPPTPDMCPLDSESDADSDNAAES
eukprot:TRINITY_DN32589_c0_g1_i1.p1 TRINITY_DN32589_c0_g1~~TRINITY_DN32589_c0_g1_i1.p1  ORF type:complete len:489 (+),score=60.49 TRINITY_DN32589_c0_g1_i1:126-1592(+)